MKNLYHILIILIISLYCTDSARATLVKSKEIWLKGEILSFNVNADENEKWFEHIIRYEDDIYLCYVISRPLVVSLKAWCEQVDIQ